MLTPAQLAELRSVNREVNKFKYTFDHTRAAQAFTDSYKEA
jgi:hypothetical protein